MASENFDYSRIFYGASAFFAVLAVLYFGFEYIQDLSPFTIAAVLFAVFASTLVAGVSREARGVKLVSYLVSAGSYLGFLIYINGRFLRTSDGTLASLLFSAVLFSAIGYTLTNKQEYIPNRDQALKIVAGIGAVLALLVAYDAAAVDAEYDLTLEEEVEMLEGENKFGELEIRKSGYLHADIERQRFSVCAGINESTQRLGGASTGGYMTGFAPETAVEELELSMSPHRFEQIDGLEPGDIFEVEPIESCREVELEEGVLGVETSSIAYSEPGGLMEDE